MTKRVSAPKSAAKEPRAARSFAISLLGLGMASVVATSAQFALGDTPTKPAAHEESVLVATREAAPDAPKSEKVTQAEALEPTAESSDRNPELASATEVDNKPTQFGEALAKIAQPAKKEKAAKATAPTKTESEKTSAAADDSQAPAVSGTARRAAAARAESVTFEAVKFQGIAVGKTTKHELITAWGQPAETSNTPEGEVLLFRKSPFQAVEVLINKQSIVATIKVTLASPIDSKKLSEQLSLDKIDPVKITDDTDKAEGLAFPERGVLFIFAGSNAITPVDEEAGAASRAALGDGQQGPPELGGHAVSHVVIQPLDGHAFALRAEKHLHGPYNQNINDLKVALSLEPEYAHAYYLLAKIYLATGQADQADAAAAEACDIEPGNASYQLLRAQTREQLGEYDDAVLKIRAVLDREDLTALDRAHALHRMARLASLGDGEIASKTISFETRSIEAADKLATSSDAKERRAAKQLLVEAHVSIAEEIARQAYNQKVESLNLWVGRASGLAEDFIEKDGGSVELRLFIAQRVLAALASFRPTLDPTPWVTEAEEAAKTLFAQSDDELWQQHVKWELGIAYLNALRVEHTRRQTDTALKYGQEAIDNLSVGASGRQAVHSSEQLVGQLYFQMGAVYAVHKLDHAKAVQWYDKAAPLLTGQRPASELYAPRREGEMLVSMGVSYWQLGNQPQAIELTKTGVSLVETAVENGVLAKSTLAVPYGNLATMYQQMGDDTNSAKYSDLAKSISGSETKQQSQRVGRGQGNRNR
jgi:tetratricopeptide (TPR) repeat protein